MRKIAIALASTILGSLLAASPGHAQLATVSDAVPDQMPFDIPYGEPIGIEQAKKLAAAAEAEAAKHKWKLDIAVVDGSGNLVYFEKMDGAQLASIAIAQHKARTAAQYRRETKVFEDLIQKGFVYLTTLDGVIGSRGGFPLVENGKLIGAIGCSGGTGTQDAAACQAGASLVK